MPILLEASATGLKSGLSPSPSPPRIMEIERAREAFLSRLLIAYISSGLVFMLLPSTFLGVWNLLQISGRESAAPVPPAWLQAHGHAQVLGWIGSFNLGIGFYSVPKFHNVARTGWLGLTRKLAGAPLACRLAAERLRRTASGPAVSRFGRRVILRPPEE